MRNRDAVVELLDEHAGIAGDGVVWALPDSEDLNANLVHLDPGHEIGRHVNQEVDVIIVVLAGTGDLHVDDRVDALVAHAVAHIPKGTARHIQAGDDGLRYLTIHRRRGSLDIRPPAARRP